MAISLLRLQGQCQLMLRVGIYFNYGDGSDADVYGDFAQVSTTDGQHLTPAMAKSLTVGTLAVIGLSSDSPSRSGG
jgi:hypothetical protein